MPRNGVGRIASLDEPVRRAVFEFVRRARRPVSREETAAEIGISRKVAAFHLDKLEERGLLHTHYARPAGRSGPGAGRSAKFYEPRLEQIDVTIPPRRYDFAADLLLGAILERSVEEPAERSALRVSRQRGEELGAGYRRDHKVRAPSAKRSLQAASEILTELGFEPEPVGRDIELRNCPFHVIAQRSPELVCGMNRSFIEGLLRGLGNQRAVARLTCVAGNCCVTVEAGANRSRSDR